MGTFVYNRNDSVGDDREYSVVFLPDVWSLLDSSNVPADVIEEEMKDAVKIEPVSSSDLVSSVDVSCNQQPQQQGDGVKNEQIDATAELSPNNDSSSSHILSFPTICVPSSSEVPLEGKPSDLAEKQQLLDHINELKVTELKGQLDEREVKYKSSAKKAELVSMLTDAIKSEIGLLQSDDHHTNVASVKADVPPEPTAAEPSSTAVAEAGPATVTRDVSSEPNEVQKDEKSQKRRHESESNDSGPVKKASRTSPPTVGHRNPSSDCDVNLHLTCSENQVKSSESVINVTGELHLMTLSLYQALNHHKNDHFEVSFQGSIFSHL